MTEKTCPSCHRPVPPDAPGGLCPVCALSGAVEETLPPDLPSLAEIGAAFPQLEVLECIGRGGMGVVYKVRQPQLDRTLALKLLLPGLHHDPGFEERFSREARALAKLSHPNIVAVHDFGHSGDFFWITMEHVDGVNLRQAMQAARFTPAQTLAVIPELCAALQYAHDQGVLHRDIKPENILLDTRGRVKIADFGIARIAEDERKNFTLTMTGTALGSAAYIAPEQIENPRTVDHRADLYSLGVVLYEMLTGELPLGRFPAPSERSTSDPRLDEVVFRTLEKEREKRYQSANEVRRGVETSCDRPLQVPPATSSPSSAKLIAASIASILIGGIILCFGVPLKQLLLIVPGLCISVLGIAGGWWALWRMKHGASSTAGYTALRLFAVWLPMLAISGFLILFHMDHGMRPFVGKGDYFVNLASLYGLSFAIAWPAFRFSRLPGTRSYRPWLTGAAAILALILAAVSLILAKQRDGRWPDAHFMVEKTFYLPEPLSWVHSQKEGASPVERSLAEAAGDYRNEIRFTQEGQMWTISLLAPDPEQGSAHFKSYLTRLISTLPAETLVATSEPEIVLESIDMLHPVFLTRDRRYPPGHEIFVGCLIPAAASALLAAWCSAPLSLILAGISLAAGGAFAAAPVARIPGSEEERLIIGPSLPALARQIPPADFSTPVKAVQTVYDAAWAGDMDLMKKGICARLRKNIDESGKWDVVMKYLGQRTLVTAMPSPFEESNRARIGIKSSSSRSFLNTLLEDGEWRLDNLPFDLEMAR